MKNRVVNVTEFKAKCLSLLNDVAQTGGTITITKRGKPLASVGPVKRTPWKSPEGSLAGILKFDDALLDADTSELWEVLRQADEGKGL